MAELRGDQREGEIIRPTAPGTGWTHELVSVSDRDGSEQIRPFCPWNTAKLAAELASGCNR